MRFSVLPTLLLASGLASATPGEAPGTSPNMNLVKRDFFDCKGSLLCPVALNFVRNCDTAVNKLIIRNDDVNYGAKGSGKSVGAERDNCKVFIEGHRGCVRTGNQIWYDYQEIRGAGCKRCGKKHWGDFDGKFHIRQPINAKLTPFSNALPP